MEKRDLILDQIEQLSFFLRKLLADFLNTKSTENDTEAVNLVTNELKNEIDFDLSLFISLSDTESKKYILDFKFTEQSFEKLAKLLFEMGKLKRQNESKKYLEKALEILNFTDETTHVFSFERNIKKLEIKELLKTL